MHQSIPPAPSQTPPPPPSPGYCRAFPRLVGGRAFANHGAIPELLTRTQIPIRIFNYTEGFTGKKQTGSFVKDRNILKRVVKACSRFYACISSLLIKPTIHTYNGGQKCWDLSSDITKTSDSSPPTPNKVEFGAKWGKLSAFLATTLLGEVGGTMG